MNENSVSARKSYSVVLNADVGDCIEFLQVLRMPIQRQYKCSEPSDWRGVGATITVNGLEKVEVEIIACPVHQFELGSILLNVAESFGLLRLLRKRNPGTVRVMAEFVSDSLIECGVRAEQQFWANSNPPDFELPQDWTVGRFPF